MVRVPCSFPGVRTRAHWLKTTFRKGFGVVRVDGHRAIFASIHRPRFDSARCSRAVQWLDMTRGAPSSRSQATRNAARSLILALCLGSAYGFGGTSLRECEAEAGGYNVNDVVADCNELGEACDLLGGIRPRIVYSNHMGGRYRGSAGLKKFQCINQKLSRRVSAAANSRPPYSTHWLIVHRCLLQHAQVLLLRGRGSDGPRTLTLPTVVLIPGRSFLLAPSRLPKPDRTAGAASGKLNPLLRS